MGDIRSGEITIENGHTLVHDFSVDWRLKKYFRDTELRVSYPINITNLDESILSIPLVTNLCTFAWITGNTLHIKALDKEMAEALHSIKEGYRQVYQTANVGIDLTGKVNINRTVRNDTKKDGSPAMLFTGGVDSTASYLRRRSECPSLITIKRKKDNKEDWDTHIRHVERFADHFGTDSYFIETNSRSNLLDESWLNLQYKPEFGRGWHGAVQIGIGYLGILAPFSIAQDLHPIYQASGATGPMLRRKPEVHHPAVSSSVRWAGKDCELVDFDLSRQEKWNQIVETLGDGFDFDLDLCQENPPGDYCFRCKECYRNILGLFVSGANPEVFGFKMDDVMINELIKRFSNEKIEATPAKYEFLTDQQMWLDETKWSGPSELFDVLNSMEIQMKEESYPKSPKRKAVRGLPKPLDEFTFRMYRYLSQK